jgi:hypothetical protein
MPHFRPTTASPRNALLTREGVQELAAEMMAAENFFVGPGLSLRWEHVPAEDVSWEVFRGRLLDPAHTRKRQSFESWNVYQVGGLLEPAGQVSQERCAEPLLSLKLDAEAGQLYVVRGLDSYAWEGYDAGSNVYLSRERRKWVRELVATLDLVRLGPDRATLCDELSCRLFEAVVGTSRLPLSSVEAPLPAFSFGQLFYCYRPGTASTGPLRTWEDLVRACLPLPLNRLEQARLMETFLRAVPETEWAVADEEFVRCWSELGRRPEELLALLREMFNGVSLSPYTDLVDRTRALLRLLERQGFFTSAQVVDFLGHLLRQVGRHLTAYDLVTFHHRGANYPDALLLDAVLKDYLDYCERQPDLFSDAGGQDEMERRVRRLRRRALRQGWLLRRRYEEHPVPDRPTSPGENSRVLPPAHPRVPEEQILQTNRRARRLYTDDSLGGRLGEEVSGLLRQSFLDLEHADERRELGLGLFLDRPLGAGKAPGEPDQTLLLTSMAFSRSVARQRLLALARDLTPHPSEADLARLEAGLEFRGLPVAELPGGRPGSVALSDARLAGPDFVFLRTLPCSLSALLAQFDLSPLTDRFDLDFLLVARRALITSCPGSVPGLLIRDEDLRPRLELELRLEHGYERRAGQESPADGLLAVRVWQPSTNSTAWEPCDIRVELPPR